MMNAGFIMDALYKQLVEVSALTVTGSSKTSEDKQINMMMGPWRSCCGRHVSLERVCYCDSSPCVSGNKEKTRKSIINRSLSL